MHNVILIGLSGAGKSSLGKVLAERFNMNFVDTDVLIEEKYNMKIKDIFDTKGEEGFRKIETDMCRTVSEMSKTVIATGGGVILKEINIIELRKSGVIIFLNRKPDEILRFLEIDERPLLKDGKNKIYNLYEQRIELYKKYNDIEIENNGEFEESIDLLEKIVLERVKV